MDQNNSEYEKALHNLEADDANEIDRSSQRVCSVKKVFLEISQNSQENTCARSVINRYDYV